MLRKSKVLAGLVIGLLLMTADGFGQWASAKEKMTPSLVISPMSGAPGTQLVFYGSGFGSEEEVRIILETNDVPYAFAKVGTGGIVKVNDDGAFRLAPRGGIPRVLLKPGVYTIEASGNQGSLATAPLEVLGQE